MKFTIPTRNLIHLFVTTIAMGYLALFVGPFPYSLSPTQVPAGIIFTALIYLCLYFFTWIYLLRELYLQISWLVMINRRK